MTDEDSNTLSWLYAELEYRHRRLVKAVGVLERSSLRSKIKRHFIKSVAASNVWEGSHG